MVNRLAIVLVAVGTACSLAAVPANAKAKAANTYKQLRTQLFSGAPTTAIFTPGQCQSTQQNQNNAPAPTVSGGLQIRDFMEANGNTIAFSDQHVTLQPNGTPVLELIQYRVAQNNTATVTVSSLSPTTYQTVAAAQVFQCVLGKGLRFTYASHERD
jgi:hypothetical protein